MLCNLQTKLPKEQLKFGSTYTDHMLEVDWTSEKGWKAPHISAYHSLSIDPAASVLHYALEVCDKFWGEPMLNCWRACVVGVNSE